MVVTTSPHKEMIDELGLLSGLSGGNMAGPRFLYIGIKRGKEHSEDNLTAS